MIRIKLFWNHICVLHRQELIYLNQIRDLLRQDNIELEVTCFGLGYASHMSDYLRRPDAKLPDIIVSADLEVFEDRRIFSRFSSSLHPAAEWFPIKQTEDVPKLRRNKYLLPYVAIPLVFYADKTKYARAGRLSVPEAAHSGADFSFGGINNSAAKTVVKTVMERYGRAAAAGLMSVSRITDMPVQAFHRVRTGQSGIALVPSIYALRADSRTTGVFCPADGAVAVPSYICARNTLDETAARAVITHLTAPHICDFYVANGNLISCLKETRENTWLAAQNIFLQLPSQKFIQELDPVSFYEFYRRHLPAGYLEPSIV